jgi:hydroxypyruvate isomerase
MAMMGEDVFEALKENIDTIGHIQFADCPGRHEPGTAIVNYVEIFQWLENSQYQGYVAAEYRPLKHSAASFGWKTRYFAD